MLHLSEQGKVLLASHAGRTVAPDAMAVSTAKSAPLGSPGSRDPSRQSRRRKRAASCGHLKAPAAGRDGYPAVSRASVRPEESPPPAAAPTRPAVCYLERIRGTSHVPLGQAGPARPTPLAPRCGKGVRVWRGVGAVSGRGRAAGRFIHHHHPGPHGR